MPKKERPLINLEDVFDGSFDLQYGHDDFVAAADITPRSPRWYWRQRLVQGDLNILAGTQGVGKSQIATAIAAEATRRGETVLIISAEDSPESTIIPRLIAAGADMRDDAGTPLVYVWRQEAGFDLGQYEKFQRYVRGYDASLVVIDPVAAYVTTATDTYKDSHVRSLLAPLRAVAEDNDCTILAVMHLKKGQEAKAVNSVGGSIAWTAAPRSVLLAKRNKDVDEDRRLLYHVKCNVGPEQSPLEYDVEDVPRDVYGFATSYVRWGDERPDIDVEDAFARVDERRNKPAPEMERCLRWLKDQLADGPVLSSVLQEGALAEAFSKSTYKQARTKLGVHAEYDTDQRGYVTVWDGV